MEQPRQRPIRPEECRKQPPCIPNQVLSVANELVRTSSEGSGQGFIKFSDMFDRCPEFTLSMFRGLQTTYASVGWDVIMDTHEFSLMHWTLILREKWAL